MHCKYYCHPGMQRSSKPQRLDQTSKSVNKIKTTRQPATEATNHGPTHQLNQPASKPTNQATGQPITLPTNQPITQLSSQPGNQPINHLGLTFGPLVLFNCAFCTERLFPLLLLRRVPGCSHQRTCLGTLLPLDHQWAALLHNLCGATWAAALVSVLLRLAMGTGNVVLSAMLPRCGLGGGRV